MPSQRVKPMNGKCVWVGIDTGEDKSRICAVDDKLFPLLVVTAPTRVDVIIAALNELSGEIRSIAVEATSCSMHLVRRLKAAGMPIAMYDAGKVSRYLGIRRNKTDNNDARGLAEIARLGLPSLMEVHLKSEEIQRLRAKLAFRHKLILHRVACEGMIRSLLRLNGGRLPHSCSALSFERNLNTEIDRLKVDEDIDLQGEISPLLALCLSQRNVADILEKELSTWARGNDECCRFLDIPGVGSICAVSFYTAVEDPWRFERTSDVGAYFGLVPKVTQSGSALRRGRISKRGNKLTRSHLCIAAAVMLFRTKQTNPLKEWGLRLAERAGRKRAQVALARRLAIVMTAMWKNGSHFDGALAASAQMRYVPHAPV